MTIAAPTRVTSSTAIHRLISASFILRLGDRPDSGIRRHTDEPPDAISGSRGRSDSRGFRPMKPAHPITIALVMSSFPSGPTVVRRQAPSIAAWLAIRRFSLASRPTDKT